MGFITEITNKVGSFVGSTRELFLSTLPSNIFKEIDQKIVRKKYQKGDILVTEGIYSNKIYLLKDGLAISYSNKDGENHVNWILDKDNFLFSRESIMENFSSEETIELLEDSVISYILVADAEKLANDYKIIFRLKMYFFDKRANIYQEIAQLKSLKSTEQRYKRFEKKFKGKIHLIPIGYIANYIGVTRETLSKIIKKVNN